MALDVAGRVDGARAAYDWLAGTQGADGSWPMETVTDPVTGESRVTQATVDSNQVSYVAVGLWHHYLLTDDASYLARMWPVVRDAIDLVVSAQLPSGAISWARSPAGAWAGEALLTGSSCIVLSLTAALRIAHALGYERTAWEVARERVVRAIQAAHADGGPARGAGAFLDKSRFSMDWYYPVLGGAVTGPAAEALIEARWEEFIVPGYGIRCVNDHPWATPAESCELVLTLDLLGRGDAARRILADVERHRDSDGGYWTGYVWPDEAIWPEEKTTWTAAAVLLAHDALEGYSPAGDLFRHLSPQGLGARR